MCSFDSVKNKPGVDCTGLSLRDGRDDIDCQCSQRVSEYDKDMSQTADQPMAP